MAYVNSEWLDRPARAQRITLLTERVTKLAAVIKAGKATDYHIDSFRRDKTELSKLKRVHRAEVDVAYFTYAYLSDGNNGLTKTTLSVIMTTARRMIQST
jgi:hypothetical protein